MPELSVTLDKESSVVTWFPWKLSGWCSSRIFIMSQWRCSHQQVRSSLLSQGFFCFDLFCFLRGGRGLKFLLTLCEVLRPKANGAQLCLVLINLDFLSRESSFGVASGRPIPFLASSSCDDLEKRTGGLRCATLRLGSNLISSDGTFCADASECVSRNPGSEVRIEALWGRVTSWVTFETSLFQKRFEWFAWFMNKMNLLWLRGCLKVCKVAKPAMC